MVHIPFSLHDAAGFDHVRAQFGFDTVSPPKSLSGFVYYIPETMCAPVTNQTAGHPAHDTPWTTPYILLINGGGVCSEVTKVRHAQMIGASAVLLAMPRCLCADTKCTNATDPNATDPDVTKCDQNDPVLVNDGSGADVSIPSFFIMKPLGDALKDRLREKNLPALVELQWGIREEDMTHSRPRFHLWTTAYDPLVSLETYVDMRTVAKAFHDVADFSPRHSVIDGTRFQCHVEVTDDNGACDHLCTNNGRYCALHATDLSGSAIVKETLRRMCIWEHFKANPANQYWDYVIYHKQQCGRPDQFANQKCVDEAMRVAKIDAATVSECMSNAGNMDADVANGLLDAAIVDQRNSGIVSLPAIAINNKVLKWTSANSLFDTICTEYWLSGIDKIPAICETCSACPNAIGCLEKGHCVDYSNEERHPNTGFPSNSNSNNKKGRRGWKIFWSLTAVFGVAGAAFYYYNNQQSRQQRHGGNFMSNYLHLSGEE